MATQADLVNPDADFDRLMDAHQTLIRLKVGDVVTQEMIDDLLLIDSDYRENDERCTGAFHKGYENGLKRGSNAETAKLIEERDSARCRASISNALRTAAEHWAFVKGAQICREMMARFVEQGGTETERNIGTSIRANWRPSWGDDPGLPDEGVYVDAVPCEIAAQDTLSSEILHALRQYEDDLLHTPEADSRDRRLERVRSVIAKVMVANA